MLFTQDKGWKMLDRVGFSGASEPGDVVPVSFGNTGVMRELAEVGRLVARRRQELGLDAAQLAREAGVDPKTVASIEHGERWPRDRSRAAIEAVLRWQTGSLDDMRAGGDPTPTSDGDPLDAYSVEYLMDYIKHRIAARMSDEPKPE
jgi:transcriptional regulator with XRE-family HTH domain